MEHSLEIYFLLFFSYAVIGWIVEVITKLFELKKFINRGFLIGPYCPIYGCGGLLITLLLQGYEDRPLLLLFFSLIICSVLEYSTSFIMEKLFNARWWDYSDTSLNINGRICVDTMAAFGVLGMVMIYAVNPVLFKAFNAIPDNTLTIITIVLAIIFVLDIVLSTNILCLISSDIRKYDKDNTEEISTKIKNKIMEHGALYKRVILAFPAIKYIRHVITEELTKDKLEQQRILLDAEQKIEKLRLKTECKIQNIREKANKRVEKIQKNEKSVHKNKKV